MNPSKTQFKRQIAAHFGAKSAGYSENAMIQQELLERLVPIIMKYDDPDALFLDTGCGNGLLERKLSDLHFRGTVVGLDIAFGSLSYAAARPEKQTAWICGDIEAPPVKPQKVTGVIAASVLQWFPDLAAILNTIQPLLAPDGVFIFSLFTGRSFHELAEIRRRSGHSMPITCPSVESLPEIFNKSNLTLLQSERFERTLYFPSAMELLRHLSSIGSTAVTSRMSRSALTVFCTLFEDTFGTDPGVPLTYEAYTGICRKGTPHD